LQVVDISYLYNIKNRPIKVQKIWLKTISH
jgi:hypothetical protein